jgi:putative addiction module component (TIGR02574 family)
VNISDIKGAVAQLSTVERLQMMESLWEVIRSEDPPSPEWHGDVLAARLAKAEAGYAKFLSIAEFKNRLNR